MTTSPSFHEPVLLKEAVDLLVTETDGIYIDGTLGGGGHSREILSRLDDQGLLFGIDQDEEAIKTAEQRIGNDSRFKTVYGNFGYMDVLLPPETRGNISGILLDLGVSSHQIDTPDRGFSFQQEAPLDMRMGKFTGITAQKIVNEYDLDKLKNILYKYGEEKKSGRIARAIVENRPISTTSELRKIVESIVKGRHATKSVARVFQAIRIEVNRELEMLENALMAGLTLLKPGGRYVVISYHSLEDRIVKNFFKSGNLEGKIKKDLYGNILSEIEMLNRKVITASDEEIARNPRARSAKLRVAIKS
ncbi:MAG TPA: 16S rRNA (cytosine(1402)-N(4))-methyltransferase RsmH [Balneolales bacterium]|nr:16S rRNA (cytosine(1402)-N(4))-methyltransferase RsmH [Balneolales bacterium]